MAKKAAKRSSTKASKQARPAAKPKSTKRKATRSARPGKAAPKAAPARPVGKASKPAPLPLPAAGSIVHTEMACSNTAEARQFMADVFGWEFEDMPGPVPYARASVGGVPIGGVRSQMENEPGPYSTPYIGIRNLNATLGAVELRGGRIVVPPTPVPGQGWFFWFQVPGGPMLAAWLADPKAPRPLAPKIPAR